MRLPGRIVGLQPAELSSRHVTRQQLSALLRGLLRMQLPCAGTVLHLHFALRNGRSAARVELLVSADLARQRERLRTDGKQSVLVQRRNLHVLRGPMALPAGVPL